MLNHLDLSGLCLPREQLLTLARVLCNCHNLMGIHLNDVGVHQDEELLAELIGIFGLSEDDLKAAFGGRAEHTEASLKHQEELRTSPNHVTSEEIEAMITATTHGNIAEQVDPIGPPG